MSKITYISFAFLIFVTIFTFNLNLDLLQTTRILDRTIELKQTQYNIITTEQRIKAEGSFHPEYSFEDINTTANLLEHYETRELKEATDITQSGVVSFINTHSNADGVYFAFSVNGVLYYYTGAEDYNHYFELLSLNNIMLNTAHNRNTMVFYNIYDYEVFVYLIKSDCGHQSTVAIKRLKERGN